MAGAATPGIAALVKAVVPHEVLHFEVITDLSESGDFAPEQVFKTLIIALHALPRELAVAIVPVPSKLSLKAAAAALGVPKAAMGHRGGQAVRPGPHDDRGGHASTPSRRTCPLCSTPCSTGALCDAHEISVGIGPLGSQGCSATASATFQVPRSITPSAASMIL